MSKWLPATTWTAAKQREPWSAGCMPWLASTSDGLSACCLATVCCIVWSLQVVSPSGVKLALRYEMRQPFASWVVHQVRTLPDNLPQEQHL